MSTDFSQRTRTIRRSERGFLRDVSEQVRPSELLLLAVVPVVLVAVALLPESTRGALAFDTADPEVVAAFTAHYVHFNEVHLYGNLVIYAVVATLAYLLAILSGRRQVFVAGFLTLLVVFPFALSGMQLAFPRERAVLGFSGLNAALFGLLSLLVVSYARAVFSDHLEEQYAPALLFITLGLIAFVTLPARAWRFELTLVSLLVGFGYVGVLVSRVGIPSLSAVRAALDRPGYIELFGASLGAVFAYPFVGFQEAVVLGDAVTDVYVHLLGYATAFIVAFVFVVVIDAIE